jgi:hypothetical protein
MIFIAGRRLVGRVEEHAGTFIVTQFWHMNFLPLVPLRSYLVLESGPSAASIRRCVGIRLHAASVLAGYLRAWCTVMVPVWCLSAFLANGGGGAAECLLVGALLILVDVWAWTRLGRLRPKEIVQRETYAALTHERVDAALLCRNNDAFRDTLHANVAEGARSLMASGYRTALDPERDWAEVALDPTVRDRAFVQACFTLARIEWGRAEGPHRAKLAGVHDLLWQKLDAIRALS